MKRFFKLRGLLMVPPMVFAALCHLWETEDESLVFGIGGTVFALGFALRVWSQMHLHFRLHIKKTLTETGPYAHVRNPIYIANSLMLAGACMLAELFWFVPVQILYCAALYTLVVRYEETRLAEKYGEAYRDYMARVPRWRPRLRPANGTRGENMLRFLPPSLIAELHNLLLLVPYLVKELLTG